MVVGWCYTRKMYWRFYGCNVRLRGINKYNSIDVKLEAAREMEVYLIP